MPLRRKLYTFRRKDLDGKETRKIHILLSESDVPEDSGQAGVLIDKLKEAEGLVAQFDRGDSPFTNRELAAAIFALVD